MMRDYVDSQRAAVLCFLNAQYKTDLTTYSNSTSMLNSIITSIGSLNIWKKNLMGKIPEGPSIYINEIISNLNHILVMASLGLKTSSLLMIRRSQENLFSFLYYKDHPIEFFVKESEISKKNQQLKVNELKEYIEDYPFSIHYPTINHEEMRKSIKLVTEKWQEQYKDLSNYVHGTNSQFLELTKFLEEIQPSVELFLTIEKNIIIFTSVINTLFVNFFFDEYKHFIEPEKSFIRFAISSDFIFKDKIRYIFHDL